MKERIKSLDEISKIENVSERHVELVLAYDNLYKEYTKIEDYQRHLRKQLDYAFGHKITLEEYCDAKDGDPNEELDLFIDSLEIFVKRAKELRDHIHQWESIYHDGRDLDGVCVICGIHST